MNKFGLLLGLSMLLLVFSLVKANNIFNISGQSGSILNTPLSDAIYFQKVICDNIFCYHFIVMRQSYYTVYINKWSKNSTSSFGQLITSKQYFNLQGLGYIKTSDLIDYDSNNLLLFFLNSSFLGQRYLISKNDLSFKSIGSVFVPSQPINHVSYADDKTIAFVNTTGSSLSPTIYILFTDNSEQNLILPSLISTPSDLNWISLPSIDEYWLLLRNNTNAYLVRYSMSQLKNDNMFLNYYQISSGVVIGQDTYQSWSGVYPEGSLFATYNNDFVYFALRQIETGHTPPQNNNTWYLNGISINDVKNTNNLITIGEQFINLTDYDTWLNLVDNQSTALSMFYDSSRWNFIFQEHSGINPYQSGNEITFNEPSSCLCSQWSIVGSCGSFVNNQIKEIRSCDPSNCQSNITFVDCSQISPSIHEKSVEDCKPCTTGNVKPEDYPSNQCTASIDIPNNAYNITSNATWIIGVTVPTFSNANIDSNYKVIICNPLSNCKEELDKCSDINDTIILSNNNYTANSHVSAQFGIDEVSNCKIRWVWAMPVGWSYYEVSGLFCVNYKQPCGNTICHTEGFNVYSIKENTDCSLQSFNESDLCSGGCDKATGKCISNKTKSITSIGVGSGIANIWGLLDDIFITPELRTLGSFIISIAVGIGVTYLVHSVSHDDGSSSIIFGLFSMLPIMFLFSIKGWLPIWITILFALPSIAFGLRTMTGSSSGK